MDTHSFRFSAKTLSALLSVCGFTPADKNRYRDQDVLCMVASKGQGECSADSIEGDNYLEVYNFFERWHIETKMFYPRAESLD